MQDLKDEITRYIEEELKYDGEVAGNVKTAMKVRLENLCSGAKGFAFNTYECLDFSSILTKNVVFELEELADDSDKAFSVGLLVIFINEFRQISKELSGNQKVDLEHLLVIEEAHRLLKNIDTERSSEEMGNPKGKAVEHFTNMLAEMRSYGQGVIVAEQIPSKLAPDVIKNSSTKIVQRIVSADDQQIMANTIGIVNDDALQLGMLEVGFALCHKEGMSLPTMVKISDNFLDADGNSQKLDVYVSDELLYNLNTDRFAKINHSILRNSLSEEADIKRKVLALLNTLFIESLENVVTSFERIFQNIKNMITMKNLSLVLCYDEQAVIAEYLADFILCFLTNGIYAARQLPSDAFTDLLKNTLSVPTTNKVQYLKKVISKMYRTDVAEFAKLIVVELIKRNMQNNIDIRGTVSEYFDIISDNTMTEIITAIEGGNHV